MSDNVPVPALPVIATALQSYGYAVQHFRRLAPALGLLFACLLALNIVAFLVTGQPLDGTEGDDDRQRAIKLGLSIAPLVLFLPFSAGLYCEVIGQDIRDGLRVLRFDAALKRLVGAGLKFLAIALIVIIAMVAIMVPVSVALVTISKDGAPTWLPWVVAMVAGWIIAPLFSRLSLILPAAANGQDLGLKAALRLGKGNGWTIVAVTLVSALPVLIPQLMMHAPHPALELSAVHRFLVTVADAMLQSAGEVLSSVSLALCYKALRTDETV